MYKIKSNLVDFRIGTLCTKSFYMYRNIEKKIRIREYAKLYFCPDTKDLKHNLVSVLLYK